MFVGILVICDKCDAVLMEWLPVIESVKTKCGSDRHFVHSFLNPECLLEINYCLPCGQCCGTVPVTIHCDSGSDVPVRLRFQIRNLIQNIFSTFVFTSKFVPVLTFIMLEKHHCFAESCHFNFTERNRNALWFLFRSCGSGLGSLTPGLWG